MTLAVGATVFNGCTEAGMKWLNSMVRRCLVITIASTQGALSGAAIRARAQMACDELTVHAEIIWSIIQRCHKSFGSERGDSLLADLQHQINELVSAEAVIVFNHVDGGASAHYTKQLRTHIDDAVTVRRNELITKLKNEARFYVQDIKQRPKTDPSGITILGNVGSVQTGDYAQAHIHINADGGARLVDALEKLRGDRGSRRDECRSTRRERGGRERRLCAHWAFASTNAGAPCAHALSLANALSAIAKKSGNGSCNPL
jgi:hypothetical protein